MDFELFEALRRVVEAARPQTADEEYDVSLLQEFIDETAPDVIWHD